MLETSTSWSLQKSEVIWSQEAISFSIANIIEHFVSIWIYFYRFVAGCCGYLELKSHMKSAILPGKLAEKIREAKWTNRTKPWTKRPKDIKRQQALKEFGTQSRPWAEYLHSSHSSLRDLRSAQRKGAQLDVDSWHVFNFSSLFRLPRTCATFSAECCLHKKGKEHERTAASKSFTSNSSCSSNRGNLHVQK